jgi:hypothetical protein
LTALSGRATLSRPPPGNWRGDHGIANSAPNVDRGEPHRLDAVSAARREAAGERRPAKFTLLVPNLTTKQSFDWSLDTAVKLLGKAAGGPVKGFVGGEDPIESVKQAIDEGSYDDVLISTLPKRRSEWLRRDLPTRVEGLGLPVSVITPPEEPSSLASFTEQFSAKS